MIKAKKFEYIIFTLLIFLVVFGLLVLYSASSIYAGKTYGNQYYLVIRQSIFCLMGILIVIAISFIPYKFFLKFTKYIFIICLVLVILTTFAGRISRGSSRWFSLKGFIFQPSEFMKLAVILSLSKILSIAYDDEVKENINYKIILVAYVPTILVAVNNLSTGIIIFMIATSMIFLVSKKFIIFIILIGSIIFFYIFAYPLSQILLNMELLKEYQVGRILAWKSPEEYKDIAYQTLQGIYAIGSGKWSGRGYLNSIQKSLIPEAHNDMIFTILCEELGLVGALVFLILFILLVYRIFYLSFKQVDIDAALITFGIGVHIAIQVIFNVGVTTNLLPNTGVTLPFVSYGGSSLIVLFIEIGIVMSIVVAKGDEKKT